jgi:cyclohexadieny/prephenate dehydrogenase
VVDTLVILAPGLLGGSVAQAARARDAARRIVIWARRPEVRLRLADQPWCDEVADTPAAAVAQASLVIIATPVTRVVDLVEQIAPHLPAHAIVTDVGSVKGEICRRAQVALATHQASATFLGSHPMAGSALTGWANGSPDLFENRICFITPRGDPPAAAVTQLTKFWQDLGSEVISADPDAHDEIVAHISHLPQLLATTLGHTLSAKPARWSQLAGNGLKDTTRIAASDAQMWIEILEQNRDEILRALNTYEDELHRLRTALSNRDWPELRTRLERGKVWRDNLRP